MGTLFTQCSKNVLLPRVAAVHRGMFSQCHKDKKILEEMLDRLCASGSFSRAFNDRLESCYMRV